MIIIYYFWFLLTNYTHTGMKKVLIASATLFLIALVYSSCKSHESCPAYGKADISKNVRA